MVSQGATMSETVDAMVGDVLRILSQYQVAVIISFAAIGLVIDVVRIHKYKADPDEDTVVLLCSQFGWACLSYTLLAIVLTWHMQGGWPVWGDPRSVLTFVLPTVFILVFPGLVWVLIFGLFPTTIFLLAAGYFVTGGEFRSGMYGALMSFDKDPIQFQPWAEWLLRGVGLTGPLCIYIKPVRRKFFYVVLPFLFLFGLFIRIFEPREE